MFTKNTGVCVRRRGFTMVELIAVLAMLAVLAAAAIPAIAGFIEHGKQINRNNIARTLYLAVQSELVKMRTEGKLIRELANPYFSPAANGYTLGTVPDGKNVYKNLGFLPAGEEAENADSVVYISKPSGSAPTSGEEGAFYEILDRVVLDKSILNNAILMEYNVETGVVLSIFYGDTEEHSTFAYLSDGSNDDVVPNPVPSDNARYSMAIAEDRRQGYYGANGTGDLLPPPDMMPQTEIFDGAFKPTPDGQVNVLYVEAYLPKGAVLSEYSLSLVPMGAVDTTSDIPLGLLSALPTARISVPFGLAADERKYQYGIDVSGFFEKYIIILDHVDGTATDALRIDGFIDITVPRTVHARLTRGTRPGEPSTTFANTLFYGEMNGGFEVASARHLYNIRYNLGGSYFQTQDIAMNHAVDINDINDFTPIGTAANPFTGTYDAYEGSAVVAGETVVTSHRISDLTVSRAGYNNIGLFAGIGDTGTVQYLNLENVAISGAGNVGAVAGQSLGAITAVSVSGTVTGTADNAGGLVGVNSGTISASSSVANVTGKNNVGGLVGRNNNGGNLVAPEVTGITVTGTGENIGGVAGVTEAAIQSATVRGVTVTGTGEHDIYIGGIVGKADGENAKIQAVTVTSTKDGDGNVDRKTTITGRTYLGGVAGWTNNEISHATVTDVEVDAYFSHVGGIVGMADKYDAISAVISDVTVDGTSIRAQRINNGGGDHAGGIAGLTEIAITKANVTDTVIHAGGDDAGGIAGRADIGAVISEVTVIESAISSGRAFTGGIVAETREPITKATVKKTTVIGDNSGGESLYIGGIAGRTTADIGGSTDEDYITLEEVEVRGRAERIGGVLGGINERAYGNRHATGNVDIIGVTLNAVTVGGITNSDGSIATPNYVGGVVGQLSPLLDPNPSDPINHPPVYTATANITKASLTNITVTGGNNVGGVAGEFAPASGGGITGVTVTTSPADESEISGADYIGGILGRTWYDINTTLSESTIHIGGAGDENAVTVSGNTTVAGNRTVGGVVGWFRPNGTGSITNVHVTGVEVSGGGYGPTGGILGGTADNAVTTTADEITITDVSVTEAVISGEDRVGGVAGEFALVNTGASVTGASVSETSVAGRDFVGGVVGDNSAEVTGVSAVSSKIKGRDSVGGAVGRTANAAIQNAVAIETNVAATGNNVGGIAGAVTAGSTLQNAAYISAEPTQQITAGGAVGGIVGTLGNAPNQGTVSDVLFLALAPKAADGKITPITATGTVPRAYYLKGKPVRPTEDGIDPPRDGYNMEALNGPGEGHSTWALWEKFNAATGGYTLGDPAGAGWGKYDALTNELAIALDNETYPYPYITGLTTPARPGWPIAGEDVTYDGEGYYYEKSGDDYAVWGKTGGTNMDTPEWLAKPLDEAGYVFFTKEPIPGNANLEVNRINDVDNWQGIGTLSPHADSDALRAAANEADTTTAYVLPFGLIADRVGKSATPLEVRYKKNDSSTVLLNFYVNPLFAKAVYPRGTTDFTTFYIRTPWQMQNIGELTTDRLDGETQGKTFRQDRSFAVTGSGSNGPQQRVGVDAIANNITNETLVDRDRANEYFSGTFDGTGFEITDLNFGTGLFAKVASGATITGVTVRGHVSSASNGPIGTIAIINEGTIENCLVQDAEFTTNAPSVGVIAGENAGTIQKTGVINAVVKGNNTIGGIVGKNRGTVEDVYLLSTVLPKDIAATGDAYKDPPVANNGGGIVGDNAGGTVTRALYLAPAPKDGTNIYPITRSGNGTVTESFYLAGSRYQLNNQTDWQNDVGYNYSYATAEGPAVTITPQGGGQGLPTSFLTLDWLESRYGFAPNGRWTDAASYPYPALAGMTEPDAWPVAERSARVAQVDRDDWLKPADDRTMDLDFVNSDFSAPYDKRAPYIVQNGIPEGELIVNSRGADYLGDWDTFWNTVVMDMVSGWSTRPVDTAYFDPNKPEGDYWADSSDGNYWRQPRWRLIELQSGNYMQRNHEGRRFDAENGTVEDKTLRYVELNADLPGTLYQVSPTTPGARLVYSFYQASRSTMNGADRMSFYLTGVPDGEPHVVDNKAQADIRDNELVLIRPCIAPRHDPDRGFHEYSTVEYGQVSGLQTYHKIPGDVYLYDVWINGNYFYPSGADNVTTRDGYGVTFWSNGPIQNLPPYGYAPGDVLPDEARTNVVGYWGVEYGWKHYYGEYTVPEGQIFTEFAYRSDTPDPRLGNLLDGISFQSPAYLTVNKAIKKEDGTPAEFVSPGSTLTVELNVESWGEIPADNIVVEDQLSPFDEYIDDTSVGAVTVERNGGAIPPAFAGVETTGNKRVLRISLPAGTQLAKGDTLKVAFTLDVRDTLKSHSDVSTLQYYIKNQAVVKYRQAVQGNAINDNIFEPLNAITRVNASGLPPAQVFIDPVSLSKTIAKQDGSPSLVNGPFTVTLKVAPNDAAGVDTEFGMINDLIPAGFKVANVRDGNDVGLAAESYTLTEADGAPTRLSIRDVKLTEDNTHTFKYDLAYTGGAYGVLYAGGETESGYRYEYGKTDPLLVELKFSRPVVGRSIAAEDIHAAAASGETTVVPVFPAKAHTKQADDAYDVTPAVVLYADGTGETPALPNGGGNYQIIDEGKYTAELIAGGDGSYSLHVTPLTTEAFTVYYKILLTATKAGSPSFTLDSEVAAIHINGSAPDPQAALPAPPAVLPPIAAVTLGLMSVALGGEAAAGVGAKGGVSAAAAALLGAVSLLLTLSGLALLPAKRRGERRK